MKITKYEVIITIVIIVLGWLYISDKIHQNKKLTEINNLYKVAQDSLVTYRNELGQQVAKIEPLIATNQAYFLQLKSKDEKINHLQNLVEQETKKRHDVETAIYIKDQTIYNLRDSVRNKIVSIVKKDSIQYPIYEHVISNRWLDQDIQLGLEYFNQKLVVRNEYDIVIGNEPNGWFKVKPYAQITNLNPASETKSIKVYQKKEVPSKIWDYLKGGVVGAGIVFLIKFL